MNNPTRSKMRSAFFAFFSPSIVCLLARYCLSPRPFSLYHLEPIPEPQLAAILDPATAGLISLLFGAAFCIAAANYLPRLGGNLARLSPLAWFPFLLIVNVPIACGGCSAMDGLIMQNRKWPERPSIENTEPKAPPNGGPVMPVASSSALDRPPSVS